MFLALPPHLSLASSTVLPSHGTLPCSRGATTLSASCACFSVPCASGSFLKVPCWCSREKAHWWGLCVPSMWHQEEVWFQLSLTTVQYKQWGQDKTAVKGSWTPQVLGRTVAHSVALGREPLKGLWVSSWGAVVSPVGGTEIETWLLCERLWGWACCFGVWVKSVMSCEISLKKEGFHPSAMWCLLAYKRLQRWYVGGCVLLSFLGANEKMGI